MVEPSTAVRSSPADEQGCWLVVLPFLSRSTLVVVVGGYADIHTAPDLRAKLLSTLVHKRDALVLDVQDLEFCDLHGLDALDDAVAAAEEAGTSVTFRGASPRLAWLQAAFSTRPTSRRSAEPCPARRPLSHSTETALPQSSPSPATACGRSRVGGGGER